MTSLLASTDFQRRPVTEGSPSQVEEFVLHAEAAQPAGMELHSIDYVPESERRGKVSRLGALSFVGNINLTALATGVTRCRDAAAPKRPSDHRLDPGHPCSSRAGQRAAAPWPYVLRAGGVAA